ncbi:MAG TPA: thioesterase family protein [Gemmataceae bacterium]|nr:thioesterase family protein [Gemmataceae bacterium]
MTPRFSRLFKVRHYELDAFGQINGVNLVRYMQEAAIEASTALGFGPDWYQQHGVGWVVRRLSVRSFAPALYGDEVTATTWLSGLRGVRSIREYDLTLNRDGQRVARGRAEWVYMNFHTGEPTRIPDAWADAFTLKDKPEDLGIRLSHPLAQENAPRHTTRRRVAFHELDTVQHVNHAVYLQWIAEAFLDALRAAGHAPERTLQDGWRALQTGHEIQYSAAAVDQENIEIISWLCETAADGAAWTHEIYNADTRKLLARDYARMSFVNAQHEPIAPPARIMENILRSQTNSLR